jgi:hypothetical protein
MNKVTRVTICDNGETVRINRGGNFCTYDTTKSSANRLWLLLGKLWDSGRTEPLITQVGAVTLTRFDITESEGDDG